MGAIMIVDDDDTYTRSLSRVLSKRYFPRSVVEEYSPAGALKRLQDTPYLYDVVITDIDFPGSADDGIRLAHKIARWKQTRRFSSAPKVICITSVMELSKVKTLLAARESGSQFSLKEDISVVERARVSNLYIEIDLALDVLRKERLGPTIRLDYWDSRPTPASRPAVPYERIAGACIVDGVTGHLHHLAINPRPLFYLEYLCLHTRLNRSLSINEIAQRTIDSASSRIKRPSTRPVQERSHKHRDKAVEMNISRVRTALERALNDAKWPESVDHVLITEYHSMITGELISDAEEVLRIRSKLATKRNAGINIGPTPGTTARYRITANIEEHIISA